MNNFIYENRTKVIFGRGGVKEYLRCMLGHYGDTAMLAYGGGSIKKNGVYDEITAILAAAGKTVVEFPGIMPNPTYAKVQEGAKLARDNGVDFLLAVGGGSVIDCCKIVSAQAMLDDDIWELEMDRRGAPTRFLPMGCVVTVKRRCQSSNASPPRSGTSTQRVSQTRTWPPRGWKPWQTLSGRSACPPPSGKWAFRTTPTWRPSPAPPT